MTRRRRWYVAVAALALLAGVGVSAYGSAYRPLTQGAAGGLQGDRIDLDARGFPTGNGMVIRYHDRTLVHGLLDLRNDGRFALRVERVGEASGPEWDGLVGFRPESNVLNPPRVYADEGPAFTPFTLHPGEERAVSVGLWLDHCEWSSVGTEVTLMEVPVRFRVLGMARTTAVRLSSGGWTVRLDRKAVCPRATTVR